MKKLALCLVVLMILTCMVGCGTTQKDTGSKDTTPSVSDSVQSTDQSTAATSNAEPSQKKLVIGASFFYYTNPHFLDIEKGFKQVLKQGDEYIYYDAQNDLPKQINQIEDMIARKVDAILLAPCDWKGIKPALESCKKAGIPVFVFDAPVYDEDLVASQIASDNYMAGQLCGKAIAEKLKDKKDVKMVLIEASFNKPCNDRARGLTEEIAKYSNIKIVDRRDAMGTIETAIPIMEDYLQKYPKIDAVFGTNDLVAIGAASVLESAGKLKDVVICSVDGSSEGRKMVREGKLYGTSAQFPLQIGVKTMETVYKYFAGEKVDAQVKVPVEFIDASNVGN